MPCSSIELWIITCAAAQISRIVTAYLAEIGLVGKGPGRYNLHLGAAFNGTRLNRKVRESVQEEEILVLLDELFADYSGKRQVNEAFGDFMLRSGVLQDGPEEAAA